MNRAITLKTARDSAWLFLLVFVAVVLFETLFVLAMSRMSQDLLEIWRRIPMVASLLRVAFGVDIAEDVSATTLMTLGLTHPVMFAATWAFLIATGTRSIVGEIDSGTADLLLTLPVSRVSAYVSASIVWALASGLMSLAAWTGLVLGELIHGTPEPLEKGRLLIPTVNLFALYLAIGSGTMLVSAWVSRRSIAVAIMIAALVASFFVNFLEALIPGLRGIGFLGLLHYYQPIECIRSGGWPLREISVLCSVAAVFWLVGLWRFSRRDIPAA